MIELSAGKYRGMRRMADVAGRFKMTAVDQRPPIKNPIREKRGTAEAPWEDVAGFKEMLIRELQGEASAMLLDPHFAYPRGVTMLAFTASRPWPGGGGAGAMRTAAHVGAAILMPARPWYIHTSPELNMAWL